MANSAYSTTTNKLLTSGISILTDNIKAVLVDSADYTANLTTDGNLSDIPVAARVATSANLANKTLTDDADGTVFDADDITFTAVTGDPSEAIVLYKDTGVEATSSLIAFIDTATGLPITPNGGNIQVAWDNGTNKIFRLDRLC